MKPEAPTPEAPGGPGRPRGPGGPLAIPLSENQTQLIDQHHFPGQSFPLQTDLTIHDIKDICGYLFYSISA